MLIAHQIALDLNNVQATYMARATGTARFGVFIFSCLGGIVLDRQ